MQYSFSGALQQIYERPVSYVDSSGDAGSDDEALLIICEYILYEYSADISSYYQDGITVTWDPFHFLSTEYWLSTVLLSLSVTSSTL